MTIALDLQADASDAAAGGSEPAFRRIGPAEFAAIVATGRFASGTPGAAEGDSAESVAPVTLLDLREPADVAVYPIEGAINAPLDPLAKVLKTVPKTRTVIVYCTEGWWSEEVAEILADRGYDVASLEGGFRAYREYAESHGLA